MTRIRTRQDELYRRALRSLPGGTDSNFRAWGERTIYVEPDQALEVFRHPFAYAGEPAPRADLRVNV